MREPRDPLLKVVLTFYIGTKTLIQHSKHCYRDCEKQHRPEKIQGKADFFFFFVSAAIPNSNGNPFIMLPQGLQYVHSLEK